MDDGGAEQDLLVGKQRNSVNDEKETTPRMPPLIEGTSKLRKSNSVNKITTVQ